MNVQPYVFFDGKCEEALEFYKGAIGAKVEMMMRFEEGPPMEAGEGCAGPMPNGKKIMHAAFKVGDTQVLASDGRAEGKPAFQGFSLTINAANDAEADKLFAALSKGGKVEMPMAETFFASRFGMVADKFGLSWMVMAEKKPA